MSAVSDQQKMNSIANRTEKEIVRLNEEKKRLVEAEMDQFCNTGFAGAAAVVRGIEDEITTGDLMFPKAHDARMLDSSNSFQISGIEVGINDDLLYCLLNQCERGTRTTPLRIALTTCSFSHSIFFLAPLVRFLRVLVIYDCSFEDFQWKPFCAAVGASKILSRLSISSLRIHQPLSDLTLALHTNRSVRSFEVFLCLRSKNDVYTDMIALGRLLAVNRTIRSICTEMIVFVPSDVSDHLMEYHTACSLLLESVQKNKVIRHLCTSDFCHRAFNDFYRLNITPLLVKNSAIPDWREVHKFIVGACLALAPIDLPAYVLLWMFDYLPGYAHLEQFRKIRLIEAVKCSVRALGVSRTKRQRQT
jgi:hypothetical protein